MPTLSKKRLSKIRSISQMISHCLGEWPVIRPQMSVSAQPETQINLRNSVCRHQN